MPVVIGGRSLGVGRNGIFTESNTDPIPGGKLWPQAAATWNAARVAAIADGVPAWEFAPAGPASSARTYAQQLALKREWTAKGQPFKAAEPGTSNHGWAIAVDVLGPRAQAWMLRHGARFGWSHDEGARVGEVWHYRYVGLSALAYRRVTRKPDALAHLTRVERRRVRELDRLRRERRDPHRRKVLVRALREQDEAIIAAARRDPHGWDRQNRLKRHRTIHARIA